MSGNSILIALLAAASSLTRQPPRGRQDGRVPQWQGLENVTDSRGFFRFAVPEAGTCHLRASSDGLAMRLPVYELEVEPRSCTEHYIGLWTDSRVFGRVLTHEELPEPARGLRVEIMLATPHSRRWSSSRRPGLPVATRSKIPVAPGTQRVSLKIVIDAVNDISGKEKPLVRFRFNQQYPVK